MDRRAELLVRDARCEPQWRSNPDLKHGMTFYFGFPLAWPDGGIFGTICVLDSKDNPNAGRYRNVLAEFKHVIDSDLAMLVVLSERERLEGELQRSNEELERRVRDRTRELQEANTALRVLLDRVEAAKRELEDRIAGNIKELVLPHIETLKRRLRAEDLLLHVGLLESNIVNATSPSSHRMALKLSCLTPTEIEIAQLIMRGSSTKQIANCMARATSTIDFHRNNIRKKLGIESRNLNLRSYLSSLH
jgi:DNA-binding CsgD family transcriptional regulator